LKVITQRGESDGNVEKYLIHIIHKNLTILYEKDEKMMRYVESSFTVYMKVIEEKLEKMKIM
jgi:hypothetical protein